MSRPLAAFPYDYSRIEAVISGFVPIWREEGFDAVVAIARGGLAPGMMASSQLSVPLHALTYSRQDRSVSWFTASRPAAGSKVLVVEDVAGRGTTLFDSIEFLRREGHHPSVFALAYDAQSRVTPDFGIEIPAGFRAWFPWERESITPSFAATSNQPTRPEYEYASWAIDLDGVLLADLPEHLYAEALQETLAQRDLLVPNEVLPGLDLSDISIITGRPEQDRGRTQAWLDRHGFHGPLVMRDERRYTAAQTSIYKADMLLARCHTHFIESDPIQALDIASRARVARVIWWNGSKAMLVYANEVDVLHRA
ncbi:MAG TPA: phosphoribosyltransferase family protein [Burkholderiaceae bacterium]|nr:phosphoribosyltransferase family protein [Burkholderiaceae bacterium]